MTLTKVDGLTASNDLCAFRLTLGDIVQNGRVLLICGDGANLGRLVEGVTDAYPRHLFDE
ncbi:hypothetical protein D1872_348250 [compost metagenome]